MCSHTPYGLPHDTGTSRPLWAPRRQADTPRRSKVLGYPDPVPRPMPPAGRANARALPLRHLPITASTRARRLRPDPSRPSCYWTGLYTDRNPSMGTLAGTPKTTTEVETDRRHRGPAANDRDRLLCCGHLLRNDTELWHTDQVRTGRKPPEHRAGPRECCPPPARYDESFDAWACPTSNRPSKHAGPAQCPRLAFTCPLAPIDHSPPRPVLLLPSRTDSTRAWGRPRTPAAPTLRTTGSATKLSPVSRSSAPPPSPGAHRPPRRHPAAAPASR